MTCPNDDLTLEKLPKGSRCIDPKDVPARSDYWRDETDAVERCAGYDTEGKGRKRESDRDDSGGSDGTPQYRDDDGNFTDDRMEDAFYWAGQLRGWMVKGPNTVDADTYCVEIMAGRPILVLDKEEFTWDESNVEAIRESMEDHGFPHIPPKDVKELDDEWRLFMEPSGDRLSSNYVDEWRNIDPECTSALPGEDDRDELPTRPGGYKLESHSETQAFWVGTRYDGAPARVPREGPVDTQVSILSHGGAHDHKWTARVKWSWDDDETEQQVIRQSTRMDETENFNRALAAAVEWMEENPAQDYREESADVDPDQAPDEVAGWDLKRDLDDQIDYSAEWYDGAPTEFNDDTEPWNIEEVVLTIRETGSSKFPNRWTVRVIHWADSGTNVHDTDIDSFFGEESTENRNKALMRARSWMDAHEATENPHDEPTDENDDEEPDEGHGEFPVFDLSIENGRLREVTEPFYRFDGHTDYGATMTVDDGGAIDFAGVNSRNTVMYETSLILGTAEKASVQREGRSVRFDPGGFANAINDVNMSDLAHLHTEDDELVYRSGDVERRFTIYDTEVEMPDFPDLDKDGPRAENIPADRFKKRVRGLKPIHDGTGYDFGLVLVMSPDEAYMVARNEDTDEQARALLTDDVFTPNNETYPTAFSADYFRDVSLCPYAPNSTEIDIRQYKMGFTDKQKLYDSPIRIQYEQRGGYVEFVVAPRIGTNDDAFEDWDLSAPSEPIEYDPEYLGLSTCAGDRSAPCPRPDELTLQEPIEAGEPVPDHVASELDLDGDSVMWFFPNSAGCRCGTQAMQFDTLAEEQNVNVYGVADSPPGELQEMGERLGLSSGMTLISDPEGELADDFGVEINDDGFERRTFFIRDGRVTDVSEGVAASALAQAPSDCPAEGIGKNRFWTLSDYQSDPAETHNYDRYILEQKDEDKLYESLEHPGVYLVNGQRGSGKSSLAYRVADKYADKHDVKPVTVGMPEGPKEGFPGNWTHVETLNDCPSNSVIVVDEAYAKFHARDAMTEENKSIGQTVNTSRHCDQTYLFVSQNTSHLDINAASEADGLLMKEPGTFHMEFERSQFRDLSETAKAAFEQLPEDLDNREYVYVYTNDYQGMVQNDEVEWYSENVSKSYAGSCEG